MIEILGWAGAALLALCGAPQAWASFKEGHSNGLSCTFLWTWFLGCVFMLLHVWGTGGSNQQIVNYLLNISFLTPILYYKYFPRRDRNAAKCK